MKTHETIETKLTELTEYEFYIKRVLRLMKKYHCYDIEALSKSINIDISEARLELDKLRSACPHKHTYKEYHDDVFCADCGKEL
jgi:hypothetical protein